MKSTRFLKSGITTGTCAAAAAKAAVCALLNDDVVITTRLTLPSGEGISVDIADTVITSDTARCAVKKYSGDDPDITDGIMIYATARKTDSGIKIDGGDGLRRFVDLKAAVFIFLVPAQKEKLDKFP